MSARLHARVDHLLQSLGLFIRRVRTSDAAHDQSSQTLSLSELSVLARIDRSGPLTTADLARADSVKPQSMGATVALLVEEGLLERRPHPTDGRQVLIHLTEQGSATRRLGRAARHRWALQAISQLAPEEQQVLWHAADILRRLQEQ